MQGSSTQDVKVKRFSQFLDPRVREEDVKNEEIASYEITELFITAAQKNDHYGDYFNHCIWRLSLI